jgi:hypothetical protein
MKIVAVMDIVIAPGGPGSLFEKMHKKIETPLIPMVGMDFGDPAWSDGPRRISRVTLSPAEGGYYIFFKEDFEDKVAAQRRVDMYKSHDWVTV